MGRTTATKLISASLAGWTSVAILILGQLCVTPVILTYWSADLYGVWLALTAGVMLLQRPGIGHQNFIGNELLRTTTKHPRTFSVIARTALRMGIALAIVEIVLAGAIGAWLVYGDSNIFLKAGIVDSGTLGKTFFLLAVSSGPLSNWGGLWVRIANAVGYYPRCAWWSVGNTITTVIAPVVVIPFGAGIVEAALSSVVGVWLFYMAMVYDLMRITSPKLHRHGMVRVRLGIRNLIRSQVITFTSMLELMRQHGARLILLPLVGPSTLAVFATTRTLANVATQGLSTITAPLMPELMRFLAMRDQTRCETVFSIVWLVLIGVAVPIVVILQAFVAPLFLWWTRGKIGFDPFLFGTFAITVLIFALAQPASAVVHGNNLLRARLFISVTNCSIAVGGIVILVPGMGIRGAAVSILVSEIVLAAWYIFYARSWLKSHGLRWPWLAFFWVFCSIGVAGIALGALIYLTNIRFEILCLAGVIQMLIVIAYWNYLPDFTRFRIFEISASTLPVCVRKRLAL